MNIEIIAPTTELGNAVAKVLSSKGHVAEVTTTECPLEKAIAETKADEARVGTPEYQGLAYFWAYDYRHYLRDCGNARRREVHTQLLAAGLPLDGVSDAHAKIICHDLP
jgi:hypothetical protein